MATANINDLRIHNARNFMEALHGPEGQFRSYIFLGRTTTWDTVDEQTQEEVPPTPTSDVTEFYRTYQEMISLKYIEPNDVFYMIRRVRWVTGDVYDTYRQDYSPTRLSFSGARNLYDARFYVINQANIVYVCLDNNNNAISVVEPQNDTGDPFYTSDGYLWLKLYTISNNDMYNHATERYIPITTDSYTAGVEGAVYTVKIDVRGSGYTNNPANIANQVPFYFCKIVGDGDGAVARVSITNQKITEIIVVRNGSGYTYGELDFTPGNVYISLADLDNNRSGLDPLGDNNLVTQVIISPPGGWGYRDDPLLSEEENKKKAEFELARELGGTRIGVFSTLNYPLADFSQDTLFRQIGILQDPEFTPLAGVNPETATACFAIKIDNSNKGTDYIIGETIRQVVQVLDTGEPDKYAIGQVVAWDSNTSVLRYIQVPQRHCDTDGHMYQFEGPAEIEGRESNKIESPNILFQETASSIQFVNGYSIPEVERYSGLITNVVNISPIKRQPSQSERISLITGY